MTLQANPVPYTFQDREVPRVQRPHHCPGCSERCVHRWQQVPWSPSEVECVNCGLTMPAVWH